MQNKLDKFDISSAGNIIIKTGEIFGLRDVYCKLIALTNLPNNTSIRIDTGLSGLFHYFIDPSYSFAFNQDDSRYPIPYVDPRNHSNDLGVGFYSESEITVSSSTDWSAYSAFICIKFTYA